MYLQLIACLCRLEIIMKNKGNQKHLTFEQRVDIEKGLTENKSFAEIGRIIGKKSIYHIKGSTSPRTYKRTSGFRLHSSSMYSSKEL